MSTSPHDFASDNHAGAHPEVLEAVARANTGHAPAYGADAWTERARALFREHFGADADAHLVFNGTGANVAALDALTASGDAVICTEVAHLHVDECGAPERHAATKLLTVEHLHGKLTADDVRRFQARRGDQHFAQPRVVSITQATELGTVYTGAEIGAIAEAAHDADMLVHMDGARLANAAASLRVALGELTTGAGVDVVSFGGTKNGLLVGDAVVFCRAALGERFEFVRKQQGQLASKMRFLAAQFEALMGPGELWLRNARHANEMGSRLAAAVDAIEAVEIVHPVEANAVFARLPRPAIDRLTSELPGEHPFYVWNDAENIVRWMCSWDTKPEDVDGFAFAVAEAVEAT